MSVRDDLLAIPDETLRRGNIGQAALVFMDFRDTPRRWWTGFGDLSVGGYTWQGVGDLIEISPIQTAYSLSASSVTFALACTPELLALALDAKARVRDRAVTVSMQLFDMDTKQSLGTPFVMFSGTMQRMPWAADGPEQRTLTVEAEGLFFRRNAPPRGRWTDSDQKARYPGDRGLERLPIYVNHETRWR